MKKIMAIFLCLLLLPVGASAAEQDDQDDLEMELVREVKRGGGVQATYKFTLNNLESDKYVRVERIHINRKGREVKSSYRSGTINGKNVVHVPMAKGVTYNLAFYSLKYTGEMYPERELLFTLDNFRP